MKLSPKLLLLLLAPALLAACTVRQLNDGSYTSCRIGDPCQVGPQVANTPVPEHRHQHHHHHMVKKAAVKAAAPAAKTKPAAQ